MKSTLLIFALICAIFTNECHGLSPPHMDEHMEQYPVQDVQKQLAQFRSLFRQMQMQIDQIRDQCDVRERPPCEPGTGSATIKGAIYTRWGRKVCPEKSELVYEGIAGGSHYSQSGGGANYICLPLDPIYGVSTATVQTYRAYVYGAEYEYERKDTLGSFSNRNLDDHNYLDDHNVPCAVCQSIQHATVLMIPARNECYPGWHVEYSGYLMAERYNRPANKAFVCVDEDPEVVPGSDGNENGALFYQVEGRCGSLPCGPYREKKELTCVVCSR